MDHCALCLNRPEPLSCRWEGSFRLEAGDGQRRLLGVFTPDGPAQLHFVEVEGESRAWPDGVRAVTVYNRSSLPMDLVEVDPGGEILPDSLRVEGQPAQRPELPGLDAGAQALFTWREQAPPAPGAIRIRCRYRFAGETREEERAL